MQNRTSSRNCKIAIPAELQFFIHSNVVMVVRPENTTTLTTTTTTATITAATATATTSLNVITLVGIAKLNFLKELQNRNS